MRVVVAGQGYVGLPLVDRSPERSPRKRMPFIGAVILSGVNELLARYFIKIHSLFFGAVIVAVVLLLPRGLVWLFGLRGGVRTWLKSLETYKA